MLEILGKDLCSLTYHWHGIAAMFVMSQDCAGMCQLVWFHLDSVRAQRELHLERSWDPIAPH